MAAAESLGSARNIPKPGNPFFFSLALVRSVVSDSRSVETAGRSVLVPPCFVRQLRCVHSAVAWAKQDAEIC